ncbi:MAG: D-2-hydroxyacid dehydrogenase [Gemmatimonadota bacterium]
MADLVLDLLDRRPIWALPPWAVEEIREALPSDWSLFAARTFADGSGDGAGAPSPEVLEAVRGARVYVGFGVRPEILEAGKATLEWVHTGTAGVGGSLHPAMMASPVQFTNSAGIHGPPMAETVLAMLLHFARGLDLAVRAQQEGRWGDAPFLEADAPVRELASMTVGIVGYGGIGAEVGTRLTALGCRVLGLVRRPRELGPGSVDGVELLHGKDGLARLLRESHAVVLAAPHTPETHGILSRERISTLRPDAVVVNVGRGKLLDEAALVEALQEGRIRGAALDVFHTEPLPPESLLWRLPNVLLTPHVSGVSRDFWRREVDLIVENLKRFLAGESLLNLVDRQRGY